MTLLKDLLEAEKTEPKVEETPHNESFVPDLEAVKERFIRLHTFENGDVTVSIFKKDKEKTKLLGEMKLSKRERARLKSLL